MQRLHSLVVASLCSLVLLPYASNASAQSEVSSHQMGAGTFELYAKVACAEGHPDAVDRSLRRAAEGADLLPDRAAEMRRGIREAHAALVARGGCAAFPAEDLTRIRENQQTRAQQIRTSGGEMELELPAGMGGKISGRASYATVAVEGSPFSVLCLETGESNPSVRLLLLSPSESLLKEGSYDLARLPAVARLVIPSTREDTSLRYAMLRISEPRGGTVRGSITGFLNAGPMFSASFTAVPGEDPCGVRQELAGSR